MRLCLTTPRGLILDTEAAEVAAPGELGEFGVLPGHIPFLSTLIPGTLTYRDSSGGKGTFAVSAGLLQVAPDTDAERILVLVQEAQAGADVDAAAAQAEASQTAGKIAAYEGGDSSELELLNQKHAWAQARLDAAKLSNA